MTAWKCFKAFHLSHNIPFPEFSLLSITSFISFLNSIKCLQVSSIKGYVSGIQFFHKLLYGAPSPNISNSQTAMLIRGIQRTRPTRPDSRLPITLDILTKCIHTLRTGYQTPSTARTLDTMFILAFFGFLRCSELAISSKFDPATNPTISDLTILDSETISFLIKQSKTDQVKRGHFVYIFNLPSPLQPYQAVREYLRLRIFQARSPLGPLFLDHAGKPASRTWFQKHLKAVLLSAGISARNFSSHSFRIGAATSAAQKGLTKHQIQTLGRWSSEAFQSYIRTDQSHIKSAHQTLVSKKKKKKKNRCELSWLLLPSNHMLGKAPPADTTDHHLRPEPPSKKLAFSTLRPESLTHPGCELPSPFRSRRVPPGHPTLPFRLYLSDSES